MSALAEFKAAERALAIQFRQFEEMKQDPAFKKALELEAALEEFLEKHKTTRAALYELLAFDVEPDKKPAKKPVNKPVAALASDKPPAKKKRKKHSWPLRTYLNPHNQQEIKIRMATNAVYTGWVAQYGKETVASWLTHTEKT